MGALRAIAEPEDDLRALRPRPPVRGCLPHVVQFDRLVEERGGQAAGRGGEQYPLQRLAAPQPVGWIVAGRGEHGKLRLRLVTRGGQRRGRGGAPQVADGGRISVGPAAERGGG